jgi:hypothetical protein
MQTGNDNHAATTAQTNSILICFGSNDRNYHLVRFLYIMSIQTALATSSAVMFSYLVRIDTGVLRKTRNSKPWWDKPVVATFVGSRLQDVPYKCPAPALTLDAHARPTVSNADICKAYAINTATHLRAHSQAMRPVASNVVHGDVVRWELEATRPRGGRIFVLAAFDSNAVISTRIVRVNELGMLASPWICPTVHTQKSQL